MIPVETSHKVTKPLKVKLSQVLIFAARNICIIFIDVFVYVNLSVAFCNRATSGKMPLIQFSLCTTDTINYAAKKMIFTD